MLKASNLIFQVKKNHLESDHMSLFIQGLQAENDVFPVEHRDSVVQWVENMGDEKLREGEKGEQGKVICQGIY